jgi:branched-subunit amino acid transport protein
MNEILIIAGMALVTLAVRYPLLVLLGRIPRPEPILRALKYVPPAVLTAIIVPAVLFKDNQVTISPTNDYLVAGLISVVVAWRSKHLLLTIIVGMLVFLGWRWVLSTHALGLCPRRAGGTHPPPAARQNAAHSRPAPGTFARPAALVVVRRAALR